MKERWRAVIGFKGLYEVSDRGRVRSLDRYIYSRRWGGTRRLKGLVLAQKTSKAGHKSVGLSKGSIVVFRQVHCLMLEAFVSPRPAGMQCAHNNGIPDRNVLSNLRWDTPQGNTDDRYRHGTIKFGSTNPLAKLTNEKIRRIRRMRISGSTYKEIGLKFGVTPQNIFFIVKGATWAHL